MASLSDRVIDKTGLTGTYNFMLRFSCDRCQFSVANGALASLPDSTDSPGGVPNIFVALQKQLGLKLVKVKDIPLDVLIVVRADKTPTAN